MQRWAATKSLDMGYSSTKDASFRLTLERWLETSGEISVLIRYPKSAGAKSFEFFHSKEAFGSVWRNYHNAACVTVFRESQLSLRGYVNEEFIDTSLAHIPDGVEYLIAGLERVSYGKASWFVFLSGENHVELSQDLRESLSEKVAVGVYPPWLHDNDDVTSAIVPEDDGSVVFAAY